MRALLVVALAGAAGAWAINATGYAANANKAGDGVSVGRVGVSPEVAAAVAAGVQTWAVRYETSRIQFASVMSGAPVLGSFGRWDAQIAFDPANLAASRLAITIDVASVATGNDAPDQVLPGPQWFDTVRFPHATFVADRFRALGADRYEAVGELSIRGIKQEVVLPFTLQIDGEEASMQGDVTLDRTAFGLGQGQWLQTDVVPAGVTVSVALQARRAKLTLGDLGAFGVAAAVAKTPEVSCTYGPYWADDYRPQPAFTGQTRAPAPENSSYKLDTLAELEAAWSLNFLPDGRMLVTERPGRMRIVDQSGKVGPPLEGLPPIKVIANTGLFDVALDPDFGRNRTLYLGYFAPMPGEDPKAETDRKRWTEWTHLPEAERETRRIGMQRIASARLSDDATRLVDLRVLATEAGLDGRIVVGRDGKLYITAGTIAAGDMEVDDLPQLLGLTYGKVLRINKDGSIPSDNPFVGREGARPEIFALGVRDPQGAAVNPATGDLWTVEHGPRGGDELNIIRKGRNYGFPTIGYGRNYSGTLINGGATVQSGMEQPIYFWTPSIAPSGLHFYTGEAFPEWRGSLFVGAMAGKRLVRLVLEGDRVVGEEHMLVDLCEPIRDITEGPNGELFLLTKGPVSKLLRLTPPTPAKGRGGAF